MMSRTPAYCFTIPSVYDGICLDCRLYHPVSFQDTQSARLQTKKGAIVAHPYGPLGGCMDDPVVMTVVEQLVDLGFVVGTFNFRGAGGSKGHTSWAGKAERDDYISAAGHLIFYLTHLQTPELGPDGPSNHPSLDEGLEPTSSAYITLILGGYSYGSLIVSSLPSTAEILTTFHQKQSSTSVSEILLRAKELALGTNTLLSNQAETQHSIVFGGGDEPSSGEHEILHKSLELPTRLEYANSTSSAPTLSSSSAEGLPQNSRTVHTSLPQVLTNYLLISPLLAPISNLLSFSTSALMFWRQSGKRMDNLISNPTLAIFGTQDMFTSSHKLDAWCNKMYGLSLQAVSSEKSSGFRWKMIEGAGHFWREHGAEAQLTESLRDWVQEEVIDGLSE